jgi:hypothetical protein
VLLLGRATHSERSVMVAGLVSVTSSNRFLKYVGSHALDLRPTRSASCGGIGRFSHGEWGRHDLDGIHSDKEEVNSP